MTIYGVYMEIVCCVAVLQNVWGRADPGDMLALMGPSGAGKSTLMDILAGRKSVGNLTGAVLVNARPRKKAEFARKTAYVPQVCVVANVTEPL